MGYAHGQNNNGREIGYGVTATCDFPGCEQEIDRGLAYCCGETDGTQNAGMEDEPYCGGFFCGEHLLYLPTGYGADHLMVCQACCARQVCPSCQGDAVVPPDDEECDLCNGYGNVAQRDGKVIEHV